MLSNEVDIQYNIDEPIVFKKDAKDEEDVEMQVCYIFVGIDKKVLNGKFILKNG